MRQDHLQHENIRDLIYIASMAAVMAVCSWISFPVMGVPLTLQTMGVFLALRILGGRRGTAAVALYILLGMIGVPVFSGFNAGAAYLIGPTGGYITGFLAMAVLYWAFEKRLKPRWLKNAALYGGLLVCYALGTAWFIYIMGTRGKPYSVGAAMSACVIPFLIPDAVKLIAAELVAGRVVHMIRLKA